MKTVLVLTYVFPPAAYVGVHRILRLCRYAAHFDWQPVIVAPRPEGLEFVDDRLSERVPDDVRVWRTRDFDPLKWRRSSRPRHSASASAGPPPRSVRALRRLPLLRPLRWLKRLARDIITRTPDSHIFWVPFAVAAGMRVLLSRPVDLIFCSTPPHSTVMAAYILSRLSRKPFVIDFRDPWLGKNWKKFAADKSRVLLRLESRIRRHVIARAALIVTVSPGERQDLLDDMPSLAPERVVCVTNGYDPRDFPVQVPAETQKACGPLVMTHTGTVYGGTAGELFAALESLADDLPEPEQVLQLHLLGDVDPEYDQVIHRLQEKGIVRLHGLRPHADALAWAMQSDLLLILLGGDLFLKSHLPAKTFEYLHTGKPILAVAQEGDLARILRESGQGIIVPPNAVDALTRVIRQLCDAKQAGAMLLLRPNPSYVAQFEAATLTRQFLTFLDRTLTHPARERVLA